MTQHKMTFAPIKLAPSIWGIKEWVWYLTGGSVEIKDIRNTLGGSVLFTAVTMDPSHSFIWDGSWSSKDGRTCCRVSSEESQTSLFQREVRVSATHTEIFFTETLRSGKSRNAHLILDGKCVWMKGDFPKHFSTHVAFHTATDMGRIVPPLRHIGEGEFEIASPSVSLNMSGGWFSSVSLEKAIWEQAIAESWSKQGIPYMLTEEGPRIL